LPGSSRAKPLAAKLGLKEGVKAAIIGAPEGFAAALGKAVSAAAFHEPSDIAGLDDGLDYAHAFFMSAADLALAFPVLAGKLDAAGALWVSWPKAATRKTSGISSDLDENSVRRIGLENGLVDVKVVSVDETWSALKFVYRLKDRA
jgi:hypothetical protein